VTVYYTEEGGRKIAHFFKSSNSKTPDHPIPFIVFPAQSAA